MTQFAHESPFLTFLLAVFVLCVIDAIQKNFFQWRIAKVEASKKKPEVEQ